MNAPRHVLILRRPRPHPRWARLAATLCAATVLACSRAPVPRQDEQPGTGTARTAHDTSAVPGDFVRPAYAPDGRRVAVGSVVVRDSAESTDLLLLDPATGRLDTLMPSDTVRRYGYYAASLIETEWLAPDTVAFRIHDGDVSAVRLVFGTTPRRLERVEAPDDEDEPMVPPLDPPLEPVLRRLVELYPDTPPDVFESALRDVATSVLDSTVVLQFNVHGLEASVVAYSLRRPQETVLFQLDEGVEHIGSFGGAVQAGRAIAFLLRRGDQGAIYLYQGDSTRIATAPFPVSRQQPFLHVRHAAPGVVFALVETCWPYERRNNLAVAFDSDGVRVLPTPPLLSDMAVRPDGRQAVLTHWEGDRRRLTLVDWPPAR